MLKIRLARFGKKNRPSYRIIVSDSRKDTKADYLENLGFYDPVAQPKQIKIKEDRVKYWLSVGAQMSPTVNNLFISQGIIQGSKVKATRNKHQDDKKEKEDKEQPRETSASKENPEPEANSDDAVTDQAPAENAGNVSEEKSE